jgi:hypothetical protein
MVSNPYHISRQGTTVSAQITDGTDAPHTGLIKALSVYSSGSYPVRTSSDFNITAASASTINITAGKVVRDGKLMGAITAGSGVAIGTNTAGSTYSLVVVNASNAFAVRTIADVNKVPELTAGDIPIALVLYTGASGTMEFQYFTTAKDENSLTIAHNGGGTTYTESGRITGDTNSIDIVSTITNADINITPNGNGKVVLDGLNWPIADGAANTLLKTDGAAGLSFIAEGTGITIGSDISVDVSEFMSNGANNYILTATGADTFQGETQLQYDGSNLKVVGGLQVGGGLEFTITESSDDITLSNTVNDKKIDISVKDGGGTGKRATFTADTHSDEIILKGIEEVIIVSLSDEETDLSTGTGKASFHMPYAMTLSKVKASVNTAPVGATIIVNIKENGTTILSTNLSIDASETTSETAASAAVISDAALADNSLITFDIDQVGGSTKGKGLKVTLYGKRV